MEISEVISNIVVLSWALVAVVLMVSISYYRKIITVRELITSITTKTGTYVYWVEKDFPNLPEDQKIDLIKKAIVEELTEAGFSVTKKVVCIEREIKAAIAKKDHIVCRYYEDRGTPDDTIEVTDSNF